MVKENTAGHPVKTDKELIQLGMRHRPLAINRSVFKKTQYDKLDLQQAKERHALQMRMAGFNPRKRLNTSSPMIING